MKKILLFIAVAFVGMKANAQVPTSGLVYRQDFTGNFTDTSSYGPATSTANTATLTADEFGNTSNAGNFELGQTIEYPFASNSQLMAGPTQLSISAKVYIDPAWFSGLANNQYVTFLMLGNSYMRVLKNGGSMLLQCGIFNNNPTSGSYGYLGVQGLVDLSSGWNTVTMTYGPELPPNLGGALRVYINGVYAGNAMRAVITPDNQPASYNSATEKLVLGRAVSANQNFKGKLDRVLVYSVCLSPTEVMNIQTDKPTIANLSTTNTSTTTKTVTYNLNANAQATTSIVRYGLSPGTLTNSVTGSNGNASGTSVTPISMNLTGLTPGARYYFQVEATNTMGTTLSAIYDELPTSNLTKFSFDNNLISDNNLSTLAPYGASVTPTFVANRFGQANKAVYINNNILTASINGLPIFREDRTVSFWVKRLSDMTHTLFSWGTNTDKGAYGAYLTNGGTAANFLNFAWGAGNDYYGPAAYSTNWEHFTLVYKNVNATSGTVTLYKNGVLLSTTNSTLNTGGNNYYFVLGAYPNAQGNTSNMHLDDFTIFKTALTATEVMAIYNSEATLSTQNFQTNTLKATIYPNPASENFIIEMEDELKSVEIYSLLGQKVMTATAKNVNISSLSKGIYMIRIEDKKGGVSTQKLIKE